MTNLRDELRAKIFDANSKKRASKILTLLGNDVELRQPTLGQISKLSDMSSKNPKIPGICFVLIEYAFVPGTDEKAFDIADAEQLASLPAGKWVDELNKAFEAMSGVDVKEAEKNSEGTG